MRPRHPHPNRGHTTARSAVLWHQLSRWARLLLASAAVALGACSGDPKAPEPPSNTTIATATTTVHARDPAPSPPGSVTLSAFDVPLAEPGLRVLLSAATGVVRVEIRGPERGSNAAVVCPVSGPATPPPATAECVAIDPGEPVDVPLVNGARGVLLRPADGSNAPKASLAEVAFTYVPADDSLTLVTPVLVASPTPGDCAGGPCRMSFRLTPTGSGTFVLDADGRNGRGQITVQTGSAGGGGSHVLARVGGGGRLRVRSSLDGRSDAELVVRNLGPADLPPLEVDLVWPTRR